MIAKKFATVIEYSLTSFTLFIYTDSAAVLEAAREYRGDQMHVVGEAYVLPLDHRFDPAEVARDLASRETAGDIEVRELKHAHKQPD